jgi:preprotein translocase subunit SecF
MAINRKIKIGGISFDYRLFAIVPVILLLFSVAVLGSRYVSTGDWFDRSIELRGGTLLTIKTQDVVSSASIESVLGDQFGEVIVRGMRGFGEYGATIQVDSSIDYKAVLEKLKAGGIKVTDFSIENTGSSLSSLFWSQAQISIILAFVFMWIITFIVFKKVATSMTTIFTAVSDMVITLAFMNIFGIQFTLASLGALLMMLGYSVDTDIMLNSRILKDQGGEVGERVGGAIKTGLTMTATSMAAVGAILLAPVPAALIGIASVLFIGLAADIVNTWMFNSVMLRWYYETKGV